MKILVVFVLLLIAPAGLLFFFLGLFCFGAGLVLHDLSGIFAGAVQMIIGSGLLFVCQAGLRASARI